MDKRSAIRKIQKNGVLLVFPVNNQKEPASLWSEFYPRSKMRWEWDEKGDSRVARLWEMMKRLSEDRSVVYSKWYQGRATFFSREVFTAMLHLVRRHGDPFHTLSRTALDLYEVLEGDSPQSTKELKTATDLGGRFNESTYNRGMRELFSRGWAVGCGEAEDSSFPSLLVGATRWIYEDLWRESETITSADAQKIIDQKLPSGSKFRRFFDKVLKDLHQQTINMVDLDP